MEPSFRRDGDLLVPSPAAVSPWSTEMVNGHHIGGLVAWAVERDHYDAGLQVTRLTVDMFRPVPMKPLRVTTRAVRTGRRLRTVEVGLFDGDLQVTGATVMLLLRSEPPAGDPWTPAPWTATSPEDLPPAERPAGMSWEMRRPGRGSDGQTRVWLRELVPFVAGEEIRPVVRAVLSADYANPLVNSGPGGLAYINTDLTVYLARDPLGEWIGVEAVGHLGAEGVGLGVAWLHDRVGRFGQTTVAAMPDRRLRLRFGPGGQAS